MIRTGLSSIENSNSEIQTSAGNAEGLGYHVVWKPLTRVPRWKRALDISIGTIALIALSPVWLSAVFALALSDPGPILFRQIRVGRDEKTYAMLKFRTMRQESEPDSTQIELDREIFINELSGNSVPEPNSGLFRPAEHPRVTGIGKFLRRYSIDELPQLINVLRGEMSLVGPRPALPWEVELLNKDQRRRHAVLPGMTGLWQVSGRNRLSSAQMFALDLEYINQCSFKTDLKILFNTPLAVIWDRHTG
jgi:lipopolysaccharide/colanic/teichoic acid biosynthesis glycosyltransferase